MQERRFHPRPSRLGAWAPPVMGMAFAFGWTPCIGPVLGRCARVGGHQVDLDVRPGPAGGVFTRARRPFLATGLAFGHLTEVMARVRRRLGVVNAVAGVSLSFSVSFF